MHNSGLGMDPETALRTEIETAVTDCMDHIGLANTFAHMSISFGDRS
jgi:hypothetical protein